MSGAAAAVLTAALLDITGRPAAVTVASALLLRLWPGLPAARRRDIWSIALTSTALIVLLTAAMAAQRLLAIAASPARASLIAMGGVIRIGIPLESPPAAWWQVALIAGAASGSALALLRLAIVHWRARALVRGSDPNTDVVLHSALDRVAHTAGTHRVPRMRRSASVASAAVYGWWRPTLLVSAAAGEWTAERTEHVLTHEVAHLTAHDAWWATLASTLHAMVWWNPALAFARRRLRAEQEFACDERVVAAGAHPASYAETLLDLARATRTTARTPGLAATGASLTARVEALMHASGAERVRSGRWVRSVAVAATVAISLVPVQSALHRGSPVRLDVRRNGAPGAQPSMIHIGPDSTGRVVMTVVPQPAPRKP